MQIFKKLFLISILIGFLPGCELSDPDEEPVVDAPVEETGEDKKEMLDLFHGSGYEGLFQDPDHMILLGTKRGLERPFTRLYRINKNGVQDTTFMDTELYNTATSIGWQNLRLGHDGHILVKGEFTIDNKIYKLVKLDRNGKIDYQFLDNLPPEFIEKPGINDPWLMSVKQHGNFYFAVFDRHVVKIDGTGSIQNDFELRFPYQSFTDVGQFKTLTVLPDGKLMLLGQFKHIVGGKTYRDLMRILPNGKIDNSFTFNYELVAMQMEIHNDYMGSAYRMLPLLDGGYLLQGNFKALRDKSTAVEYEHDYLVKLTSDFSIDLEFKFSQGENDSNYTQLDDGRLLFCKTTLQNNTGYLLIVDSGSGEISKEIRIGLNMIGGSDPLIHEGKVYIFSMFYEWLPFRPNYEKSLPFLSFEIEKL